MNAARLGPQQLRRSPELDRRVYIADMPWLVHNQTVIASLTVASTRSERRRGLLGRDGFEGALLLAQTRAVHTVGMRFALDVAHLDTDMKVLSVRTMAPGRVGRWVPRAQCVLEAEAGSFRRWGIAPGVCLEVRT